MEKYFVLESQEHNRILEKFPDGEFMNPPLNLSDLETILNNKKEIAQKKTGLKNKTDNRNLRILIAEDNLINQKVAMHILDSAGYSYKIANNGKEAIEMHKEHQFHLILMDYNMPIMGGIEATLEIRKQETITQTSSIIIAMTASALNETKTACLEAGMNDYITKPVKPNVIIEKITKIFENLD